MKYLPTVTLALISCVTFAADNDIGSSVILDLPMLTTQAYTEANDKATLPLSLPLLPDNGYDYDDGTTEQLSISGLAAHTMVMANSGGRWTQPVEVKGAGEALKSNLGSPAWPYTRYRLFPNGISTYRQKPYRQIGRLVFSTPHGRASCTASIVNSQNMSVIWTAGHCVHPGGLNHDQWRLQFYQNFRFYPGKHKDEIQNPCNDNAWRPRQSRLPDGRIDTAVYTFIGWGKAGDPRYDMAALVIQPVGNLTIAKACGFLGFAANLQIPQEFHVMGYPRDKTQSSFPPVDGKHLEICATTYAALGSSVTATGDVLSIGVGCDQGRGASGGPWLVRFNGVKGFTNMINSNVSYGLIGKPGRIYGPFFGDNAIRLRDFTQKLQ